MRRSLASIALAISASLVVAVACTNATSGVPATIAIAFEGGVVERFTTVSGWEVELTEARAVVGRIYVYAPLEEEMAWRAIVLPRALAHGGFDSLEGRRIRAELLEPHAVDALAVDRVELGVVDGLAGLTDSATIVLDPPEDDGPTQGHHVWIAGIARRGEEEVPFEGGLAMLSEDVRRVSGIAIDPAELSEGAVVVFGARPELWIREADFSTLETGENGVAVIGGQPERALYLGSRSAASWTARVEGGE